MIYLERNAEIITEINRNQLPFTRGQEVGASSKTFTVTVGSYKSTLLGTPVHIVLKESPGGTVVPLKGVKRDLTLAALIYEHLPLLRPELPLFIGLVTDEAGEPLGELTEDFTKGGQYRIRDLFRYELTGEDLAEQVRELIGGEHEELPHLLTYDELAHLFFKVESEDYYYQRRLGDFDTAWLHMANFGDPHRDLEDVIGGEMSRHTVGSQLQAQYRDY